MKYLIKMDNPMKKYLDIVYFVAFARYTGISKQISNISLQNMLMKLSHGPLTAIYPYFIGQNCQSDLN